MSILNSNNFLYKTVDGVKQFFSPLVNASTVVLQDGSRLEKDGKIYVDQAVNAETFGGKEPKHYIQPRNLLDNSDFTNPVNQRGWTSGNGVYQYTIDRWTIGHSANESHLEIVEGVGVKISPVSDSYVDFNQNLEFYSAMKGKTYTFACKDSDDNIYMKSFSIGCGSTGSIGKFELFSTDARNVIIRYYGTVTLVWAALYEGEYTAENLPPYVPKGYGAELMECQRYYWQAKDMFRIRCNQCTGTVIDFLINFPVPMRIEPQLILPSEAYIYTLNGTANSGFTLSSPTIAEAAISGYMMLRATKSSHGLTDGWIGIPTGTGFSADL